MADDLAGRLLSGFRLEALIGEGAHGSVWRARQLRLDRDVAVKILDPLVARNPETLRRFEREGRAAASIDHPNVVPVYEAGEADGLAFLAMRLVDGTTLEEHLTASGPVTPEQAADLLEPVAEALDHVHGRGLVHRDVKPSNILLEGDRTWLADFGIAGSLRELGSYTTGALGTAEYMAPEQANAADVDHRADLYGLGCVAHFAMEGRPPFTGDDLISTLMAHVNEPVAPTGDGRRDGFYARALAKAPDERFDSAAAMIAALRGAPTISASGSGRRPSRLALAVAAVLAVVLAVVAVVAIGGDDDPATSDASAEDDGTADAGPVDGEDDGADAGDENGGGDDVDGGDGDDGGTGGDGGDDVDTTATTEPPVAADDRVVGDGGSIEVATGRRLVSLNPHVDLEIEPFITTNVLPPLMAVEDDWTLTPWLAAGEPVVRSTTPFIVRWTLRDDAVWDDGTPITADDVAATLSYISDPTAGVSGTGLYDGVNITVLDATTFDLTFPAPSGAHRLLFSTFHPVIKADALDQHIDEGNPAGTFLAAAIDFSGGPFRVSGYDAGERVSLVRNDAWWGEPAHLERVTIRNFDSSAEQLDAVENGDVDLAYVELATTADAAKAAAFAGTAVAVDVGHLLLRLDFNTRLGATAELAIRQAIATALDRFLVTGGVVTPVTGELSDPLDSAVWPSAHPANDDPFDRYGGDPGTAAATLQDAGWVLDPDGGRRKAGTLLELEFLYEKDSGVLGQTLAQTVVNELAEINLRIVATPLDRADLEARRVNGDYDLVAVIDVASPDPVSALLRWGSAYCPVQFDVAGCTSTLPGNTTGIADATLDDLLDRATAEPDPAARDQLYREVDTRLAELVPTLPLAELPVLVVHRDELGDVDLTTQRSGPFGVMGDWGFLGDP